MDNGERDNHAQNMARAAELNERQARIRELNDTFRASMFGGRWVITSGVKSLGSSAVGDIVAAVRSFNSFDYANDRYHEHDFGCIEWGGSRIFFKIDCYDKNLEFGSLDPTDRGVTTRVITIMLASEY